MNGKAFLIVMVVLGFLASASSVSADTVVDPSVNEITILNLSADADDTMRNASHTVNGSTFTSDTITVTGASGTRDVVDFDGTNNRLENFSVPDQFDCANGCSIGLFVEPHTLVAMFMMGASQLSPDYCGSGALMGGCLGGTNVYWVINGANAVITASPLGVNTWYHLTFVTNATTGTEIYVDGVKNVTSSINRAPADVTYSGIGWVDGVQWFNGRMACFRYFNATLDQEQIGNISKDISCAPLQELQAAPLIPAPAESMLAVNAIDFYDNVALNNLTVTIWNSTATITNSSTTGSVKFGNVANITTYNINVSSNDTGGYFNLTDNTITIHESTGFQANLTQTIVTFSGVQLFTGVPLTGLKVNVSGQGNESTGNTSILLLRAGTYIVNGSIVGNFNTTTIITVSPLEVVTIPVSFWDALFNLTLVNKLNNNTIQSSFTFNFTLTNSSITESRVAPAGGTYNIPTINNHILNITIPSQGTISFSEKAFHVANQYNNFTMFTQILHSVNLEIFSESLNVLFGTTPEANTTVLLDFIGPTSFNATTDNGTLFITNLTPGDYEIRYSAADFNARSYFFELPVTAANDIDLFLLNTSLATIVVPTIVNENNEPLNGTILKIMRFYASEGVFKTVEMSRAGFNGEAPISVVFDLQPYTMIVEKDNVPVFNSGEFQFTNTVLTVTVNLGGQIFDQVDALINTFTSLTLLENGANKTFTYTTTQTSGFTIGACLDVVTTTRSGTVNLCSLCSISTASTLICNVNDTSSMVALGTLNISTNNTIISDSISTFTPDTAVFQNFGPFIALFLVVTMIFAAVFSVQAVVFMGMIGVAASVLLGVYSIGFGAVFGLIGAGLVLLVRKRT